MAQVTVKINGFTYSVGCEDGQEHHLLAMAEQIEHRVQNIKALGSQSGEARLLMLAALVLADELHDLTIEANSLRTHRGSAASAASGGVAYSNAAGQTVSPAPAAEQPAMLAPGPRLAEQLMHLATRAEEIAEMLENS